jgi:hypothetical protein
VSAAELRIAAVWLRCDHRHPCQPPHGSIARPGDCSKCGAPYGSTPVSDELREPLAALLDEIAVRAERDAALFFAVDPEQGPPPVEATPQLASALAVARIILGGGS